MAVDKDPFGDDADEAQQEPQDAFHEEPDPEDEPAPAPKKAPAKKAPTKAAAKPAATTVVNQASDGKWVVTLKGGTGYDAPWLVGHLDTLEDVNDHLSGEKAALLVDTMDKLQKASKKFVSLGPAKPAAGGSGGGGNRSNAPQEAQEAPNGEERFCAHGKMKYKTGVSKKTGKAWRAFMCNSGDRDNECDAQFLRG